jgi:hypothetical protein
MSLYSGIFSLYTKQRIISLYPTFQDNFVGYSKVIRIPIIIIIEAIYAGQKYQRTTVGKESWEIQITIDGTLYYRKKCVFLFQNFNVLA